MPAKLTLPKRTDYKDRASYETAARQSIREQRPYLKDDEIDNLFSIAAESEPVATVKPIQNQDKSAVALYNQLKGNKELTQKQKENLRNIQYPSNVGLTQDTYDPKVVAQEKRRQELRNMEDPNRAAATIGMIERFMPTPKPKDEGLGLTPVDLGVPQQTPQKQGYVQPQVMSTEVQKPLIQAQDGQAENIRQQLLAKQAQPQIDQFDEQAEVALPQGSPNQKKAYAAALRSNDNKLKTFQSYEIAKEVPNEVFEKAINKNDILTQDRGTLISQKYGGDAQEINKGLREYIDTEDFKAEVIKATNNNPAKYKEVAQMVLDQKADELAGAPTALERKMQKFSDWAAQNGIVGDALYGTAKTATSALKGLTDVGAMGAGIIGGAKRTLKDLSQNKVPDITGNVFESLDKSSKLSKSIVPQVYSEKADPITQGISDVTSTIAAIMTPMTAAKPLSIFQKARQALSGAKGAAGLEAGAIVQGMKAGKTAANTLTTDIAKVLNSKSANSVATVLDNTVNNYVIMGAPTLEAQKQKYLDMGFSEEYAERRASGMTFVTMLGLALPNVLRPHEMPIVDRILEKGGFKQTAKGALKQGRNFALDMAALGAIEKQIDKRALRAAGIEEPETTFEDDLKESGMRALHDTFVGIGMNIISKGRAAQTTLQRKAIADAFEKPFEYSESVKDAIRKGKMTQEDAQKYQSFLNTIKPQYEATKAETVTLPSGEVVPKFSPDKAVQVAIERTKINQAKDALQNELNREERFVTYETDKDGNPIEKVVYKHSDGKFYDYREPSVRKNVDNLMFVMDDAAKQIMQIERGQDVRGRLLSAKQMIAIAEANSLNGKLKKGQKEAIESGAPYETVVLNANDFAKQPEVAAKVKEFEAMEELPELPTTNDPVVVDGKVVEGTSQVAKMIVKSAFERAGGKMTFAQPVEPIKIAEATNEAFETKIGIDKPKLEGLPENEAKGVQSMNETFGKSIEEGNDAATALKETAKEGIESFVEPEVVVERIKDAVGEDTFSDAMIDNAVKEAKKELVVEPIKTEEAIVAENPLESVEATAKALEGVEKDKSKSVFEIGKKIYDSIFSDLDTKESEIKAFLNIDEKQRDKQLQLEKGKLDKLQRQYDRKQLTTEADINALEKQREKVELIENLLKSQKGTIADIDNQLSQYALEKYPDIFTKKETYPFYTAKGFDNVKNKIISEAYHKAKSDGTNPELVKAVEELLKQQKDGRTELESTARGSELKSEQSEGGTSETEQGVIGATEKGVGGEKEKTVEPKKQETQPDINTTKAEYDKLLELHNKKRESRSESRKQAAEQEAKKITEGKPAKQVLSENFKTILLKLKELKEIDVRNIEDC